MRIRAYSAPTVSRESRDTMNAMSYAFEESSVSQEAMSIYRDLEKFGKVSDEFFSLSFEGNMSRARIIYNQKEVMRLAKIMNFRMDIPTISTEDCENNIEYARQLSIESGDSFLSRMWDSIVDFINRVIDWFKNLFGSSSGGGGGSSQAKELLEDKELKEYVDKLKSDEKVKSSIKYPICSALNQIIENDPANLNGTLAYAFELSVAGPGTIDALVPMIARFQARIETLSSSSGYLLSDDDSAETLTKTKIGKVYDVVEKKITEIIRSRKLINDDLIVSNKYISENLKPNIHIWLPWVNKDSAMYTIRYQLKSGTMMYKTAYLSSFRDLIDPPTVEEYYFTKSAIDDYTEVLNYVVKNSSEIKAEMSKVINALTNLVKQTKAKEKSFSKTEHYQDMKEFFGNIREGLNMSLSIAKNAKEYNENTPKLIAKIKSDLKQHFKGKEKDKEQGAEA